MVEIDLVLRQHFVALCVPPWPRDSYSIRTKQAINLGNNYLALLSDPDITTRGSENCLLIVNATHIAC